MGGRPSKPSKPLAIVIVGAGPGGAMVATQVIKQRLHGSHVRLTVVDKSDSFNWNVAALRSVAVPGWSERHLWPYSKWGSMARDTLPAGAAQDDAFQFLQGEVTAITDTEVVVHSATGDQTINFDYCVIATGQTVPFPANAPQPARTERVAAFTQLQRNVAASKSVVIVGGGLTGCELAGEIAAQFGREKSVTLVHNGPHLLHSMPELKAKVHERVATRLAAMGVRILCNQRADLSGVTAAAGPRNADETKQGDSADSDASHVHVNLATPFTVPLSSGEPVQGNVVVFCGGGRVNSGAYRTSLADAMDDHGRLRVDNTHAVQGHPTLFAIGDCCNSPEPKLAALAMEQAKFLVANFTRMLKGKAMKPRKFMAPGLAFIPIGPRDGVALFKGMVLGRRIVTAIKSKDLFVKRIRGEMFTAKEAKVVP